jgi:hypothetical protein
VTSPRFSIVVTLTPHGYQYVATDYLRMRSAKENGFSSERVAYGHGELCVARWKYGVDSITSAQEVQS